MRKFSFGLVLLLICIVGFKNLAYAQVQYPTCNSDVPKIYFNGAAPSPWAIDGEVVDWETILGPGSGNAFNYYNPPPSSGFNWSFDGSHLGQNIGLADGDHPEPINDLRFLSFIHDDYNVYFYLRRIKKTNDPSTFFYFCDVNADGFMNTGEPVFKATFSSNFLSALSICRYIPNTSVDYVTGKGNLMYQGCTLDGYSMVGTVEEIFNSSSIPVLNALLPNEIFSVQVTENGYGAEFAIPWRYLKNWTTGSTPLLPGEIFFYHTSIQPGSGSYQSSLVADNAGACPANRFALYGQDLGLSGPVDFSLQSSSVTTLVNGLSYRFKLNFKNNTSAAEMIKLGEKVDFYNIVGNAGLPVDEQQFSVNIITDLNCNGNIDAGEPTITYVYSKGTFLQQPITYTHPFNVFSPGMRAAPYGNACFIVDVSLPPNGSVRSFSIQFHPKATFDTPSDCTAGDGGKPINPIGFTVTTEEESTNRSNLRNEESSISDRSQLYVYPNPSAGTATVVLPAGWGKTEITITDQSGKFVLKMNNRNQQNLVIEYLKPGFYLLNIRSTDGKNYATRKMIVH